MDFHSVFFICFSNVLVYFNLGNFHSDAPNRKKGEEKGFLFTTQKILKGDMTRRKNVFFLMGTVVCMKILIVTRTSMELQRKVVR